MSAPWPWLAARARTFARDALEALYPPTCPVCRAPSLDGARTGGCADHAFDPERGPAGNRCPACLARISDALPAGSPCADCRRAPRAFARVLALGDYREEPALREWILAFKHGGRRDLAEPLGGWLAQRLAGELGARRAREALLVPVPLHPLRRLERGYDQAVHLAEAIGRAGGGRAGRLLRRARWTPVQGSAGAPSRAANVARAFVLRREDAALAGREPWLVDDVLTSGATADACARVLCEAGASAVSVLCLARAGERERETGGARPPVQGG